MPTTCFANLGHQRLARALALLGIVLIAARAPSSTGAEKSVNVLYAGSLVNLMEHDMGPAFTAATGEKFQGYAGGSSLLANQIKGRLRQGDIFISASPKVNATLMGSANGSWVTWYVSFGQSALMIGYNPGSRFASDFKTKPWYEVLAEPGIRIGRTDPNLDPKGALAVKLLAAAESFYHRPGLARQVLGADENPAQVLPEETLVGRIQSGQLDAGFFYSTEINDARIPAVSLPAAIAPKAVYTVTILRDAPHATGARRFVAFLLGSKGKHILTRHGIALSKPVVSGEAGNAPAEVRALATGNQ